MLKVAELARELNISVQSVYRMLNNVEQSEKELMTEKRHGAAYFTQYGEEAIRARLTELNSVKQSGNGDETIFLREQIKSLRDELKTEREHSRNIAEQLVELTRNSQILLKHEQDRLAAGLIAPAVEAETAEAPETEPEPETPESPESPEPESPDKPKTRPFWQFWKR